MIAADAHPRRRPTKVERKRQARVERERFAKARRAEADYARHLRRVADGVGETVRAYAPRGWVHGALAALTRALEVYAERLEPWARAVARRMLADVARRDARAWRELGEEIGRPLRREIETASTGATMRSLQEEQVALIKSIPRAAAERVQRLAEKAIHEGARADALAREILRTTRVSRSKAELIARTETGRAQTSFTEARARHLGSLAYVWRTARDGAVRESHRRMEGRKVPWNAPPTLDKLTGHAGALPNCRCWPEPIFED